MITSRWTFGIAALALCAAPAFADTLEERVARVEQQLAAPSAREIQSSVDAYLASAQADATLVGGAGQAGYDGGFWIRGGMFLLKINLTLQTRFEYFDWNKKAAEPRPGGDLSGFSVPRAQLKFSGDATCDIHYFLMLEFGHVVSPTEHFQGETLAPVSVFSNDAFGNEMLEGWIEYETSPWLTFRMGLIQLAGTRQLMTPAELQQFVDISLASAFIGSRLPGWIDRNRDYGIALHGVFGCNGEWSYLATVTNGEGIFHRNVLDPTTADPLAYTARVNWNILGNLGYEEGALRQRECEWSLAVGAWGHYQQDHVQENPLIEGNERWSAGADAALGYGGFSLTGAFNWAQWKSPAGVKTDFTSYLVQAGYLFPGTAWEIAARWSAYLIDTSGSKHGANEFAGAVNYYIDGHADKVTVDAAFITKDKLGNIFGDAYPAYWPTDGSDGMLLRLQWQLAL